MHANTFVTESGLKTRRFDDILAEIKSFFAVHRQEGTVPGGVHLELTAEDVTECLGGAEEILDQHLDERYRGALRPAAQRTSVARPRLPDRRDAPGRLASG